MLEEYPEEIDLRKGLGIVLLLAIAVSAILLWFNHWVVPRDNMIKCAIAQQCNATYINKKAQNICIPQLCPGDCCPCVIMDGMWAIDTTNQQPCLY